jgi:muramoyltetrapeptide carboxypeptidase
MSRSRTRIGVVAPASRISREMADEVGQLAQRLYPGTELHFHPQCFLTSGHFAGPDAQRARAVLDIANDPQFDAVWFARGGYGSGRIAGQVCAGLEQAAREKIYLGYSDLGFMLAGLYRQGCRAVHGPMPADLKRMGGEEAVARALRYLVERAPDTLEPSISAEVPRAAFNITVLGHLLGTPLEPDLAGHVLMLEDVSEHIYRIDRAMFHISASPNIRRVAGIRLGRISDVPPNDPEFGQDAEAVMRHWCEEADIAYLGRADIGHDIANKIVPFGRSA